MKRQQITVAEISAVIAQPLVSLIASAHGPNGSKTFEIAVDLRTAAMSYIVNKTIYSSMNHAVEAYNEAPGP